MPYREARLLNMRKCINIRHPIDESREKSHMIILVYAEKLLTPFSILKTQKRRKLLFNMIKNI
jgi:hypothetical protein